MSAGLSPFLLVIAPGATGNAPRSPGCAKMPRLGHKVVACLALPELLAAARSPPGPERRCCLPGWSPCAERVRLGCGAVPALSPSPGAGGQVARGAQNKPCSHLTGQPGPSGPYLRLFSGGGCSSELLGTLCFSGGALVSGLRDFERQELSLTSSSRCGQGLPGGWGHSAALSWRLAVAGLAALRVVATSPSWAPCSRGRLPVAFRSCCDEDTSRGLKTTHTRTISSLLLIVYKDPLSKQGHILGSGLGGRHAPSSRYSHCLSQ